MLTEMIALLLIAASGGQGTGQSETRRNSDDDMERVICRAPEPVLGSRVAQRRICRTRAQWIAFEHDRAQLRRDLQNSARCGGNPSCTSD